MIRLDVREEEDSVMGFLGHGRHEDRARDVWATLFFKYGSMHHLTKMLNHNIRLCCMIKNCDEGSDEQKEYQEQLTDHGRESIKDILYHSWCDTVGGDKYAEMCLGPGCKEDRTPEKAKLWGKTKKTKRTKAQIQYAKDLMDQRWLDKRDSMLQRDSYMCQICEETKSLHVHHIKYTGKPWEAPDKDLITLCKTCHEKEHAK